LRPNPDTKEFELNAWFPFSSLEEIKANTGWALKVAPDARAVAEPNASELAALRKVDETGALRKH
jgi:glutaconate CoA-transferase subunit B